MAGETPIQGIQQNVIYLEVTGDPVNVTASDNVVVLNTQQKIIEAASEVNVPVTQPPT